MGTLDQGRLHQHHLGGPEFRLAAQRSHLSGEMVGERLPPPLIRLPVGWGSSKRMALSVLDPTAWGLKG